MTVVSRSSVPPLDLRVLSAKENLSLEDVQQAARSVAGDPAVARDFMTRPNPDLQGKTPEEAVREGEGQRVIGILAHVAGV